MIVDVKAYSGEQNDARVKAAINHIYRTLKNALKWPALLIPAATPITLVSGTQQYSLASNFKYPYRFWVKSSDETPIFLRQVKYILNDTQQGSARRYRIKKASAGTAIARGAWVVELEEIPGTSFVATYTTLYYDYYYTPDDLSGNSDQTKFDDDFDSVIVLGASILLVAKQDDQRAFGMLATMYTDAKADMIQKAIEFYGEGIIVKPGEEITEDFPSVSDYGRKLKVG